MKISGSDAKVCPDCSCDYLSHVETCLDCGTALLAPEENATLQAERKRCREGALEEPVAVRQGELQWVDELYRVLIESGIPAKVSSDSSCGKGCRPAFHLLVAGADAEKAHHRIEEHFSEVNPEAGASWERMSQGKCPACGTDVTPDTVECPDCGLTLLVIE
jgi:hypothetical protein